MAASPPDHQSNLETSHIYWYHCNQRDRLSIRPRALARNGIAATISNSCGPDTLRDFARELTPHITAGTIEEAAEADLVLVAVPGYQALAS